MRKRNERTEGEGSKRKMKDGFKKGGGGHQAEGVQA